MPKAESTRQSNGSLMESAALAVGRTVGRVLATVDRTRGEGQPHGLHEAFVDELRDAYDAEKQLVKALPKLAGAAAAAPLRQAFEEHLEQTRGHAVKLEQVFASIREPVRGKHCAGMAGIIEEGQSVMSEPFDPETMDACLIAGAQRAEHYEMAAYGTLIAWAKTLGHGAAVSLLEAILEEEKAADAKLSTLAESGINRGAVEDERAGSHSASRTSTGRRRPATAKRSKSGRAATRASAPPSGRSSSSHRTGARPRSKSSRQPR